MTSSTLFQPRTAASFHSPTTATISLPSLAHNLTEIRRILKPNCSILAVVKADAYGHGALPITKHLTRLGVRRFGVATVQEGVTLRGGGIREEIIILGGQFPGQLEDLVHYQLTPVISDPGIVEHLKPLVQSLARPYPVHVKVDTGMGRLGLPMSAASTFLCSDLFTSTCALQGIMTHLADADNADPAWTQEQLHKFQQVVDALQGAGVSIPTQSAANTAGILFHPSSHLDMVRPGIMLFGYPPTHGKKFAATLKPVMRITTQIVQIRQIDPHQPLSYNGIFKTRRKSRIAVLPIGYANGYSRQLSNKGEVLVANKRAPIVGRICMDMMLIDITDIPEVQPGEEVMLLGSQGDDSISALDLARWQDTAPYEVLCSLGPRVNRVYEGLENNGNE